MPAIRSGRCGTVHCKRVRHLAQGSPSVRTDALRAEGNKRSAATRGSEGGFLPTLRITRAVEDRRSTQNAVVVVRGSGEPLRAETGQARCCSSLPAIRLIPAPRSRCCRAAHPNVWNDSGARPNSALKLLLDVGGEVLRASARSRSSSPSLSWRSRPRKIPRSRPLPSYSRRAHCHLAGSQRRTRSGPASNSGSQKDWSAANAERSSWNRPP